PVVDSVGELLEQRHLALHRCAGDVVARRADVPAPAVAVDDADDVVVGARLARRLGGHHVQPRLGDGGQGGEGERGARLLGHAHNLRRRVRQPRAGRAGIAQPGRAHRPGSLVARLVGVDSDALPLSRATVERDARRREQGIEAILADPRLRVLRVRRGRVEGDERGIAFDDAVAPGAEAVYLGRDAEGWSYVADLGGGHEETGDRGRALDDPQGPPSGISVRDVGWQLTPRDAGLSAAALALAGWHASHRFCSRCGAPTTIGLAGWERHCVADGTALYPRTDPAVIMAVVDDDDRLLLGHGVAWPEGQFSVPAGFVEPGESLEAAVRREVAE